MTPAEARVVAALLADYPVAGLGTVARLARRAGVSGPTVVRLVAKLGFGGFAAFQEALLAEVEDRLRSPLMMLEARGGGTAGAYLHSLEAALGETRRREATQPYAQAAALIMDRRLRVSLHGGRFSRFLAGILHTHLVQLRPGVQHLDGPDAAVLDALVDLGKRDLLVLFDYRRYQADVVALAGQAAAQGARIILFTDPWGSPVARHAQLVFAAPVEVASPYDSMVPALAQIEALMACLVERRDEAIRERVRRIEELRGKNHITLD